MLIIITSQGLGADNRCSIMLIVGGGEQRGSEHERGLTTSIRMSSKHMLHPLMGSDVSEPLCPLVDPSVCTGLISTYSRGAREKGSAPSCADSGIGVARSCCRSLLVLDKCAFIDHHSSLHPSKANRQSHCTRRRAYVSDWCKASCMMWGRTTDLPATYLWFLLLLRRWSVHAIWLQSMLCRMCTSTVAQHFETSDSDQAKHNGESQGVLFFTELCSSRACTVVLFFTWLYSCIVLHVLVLSYCSSRACTVVCI